MPFTLSHPAIIVPLARWRLPLSALVIGSMAPDFPTIVMPTGRSEFSHSLPGIFLACLPMSLAALCLFHFVFKFPLLDLLPAGHRARLTPVALNFRCHRRSDMFKVVVALLIGTFSHIIWDNMTHTPLWNIRFIQTPFGEHLLSQILQQGSSLVGLILLAISYVIWYRRTEKKMGDLPFQLSHQARRTSIITLVLVFAATLVIAETRIQTYLRVTAGLSLPLLLRPLAIIGLRAGLAELLLFCIIWHWYAWHEKKTKSTSLLKK